MLSFPIFVDGDTKRTVAINAAQVVAVSETQKFEAVEVRFVNGEPIYIDGTLEEILDRLLALPLEDESR